MLSLPESASWISRSQQFKVPGRIRVLKRTGEDGSAVNDRVYSYDADGNMTFDGRTGMALSWNDLGLVEKVSLGGED